MVTYSSLTDMLSDTNRTGTFSPGAFAENIFGSGSDGSTYWNVFNIENETSIDADIVTYASLTDMFLDTNRTGTFSPGIFAENIVGSGSDGSTYWNVFNIENEGAIDADIVTYASLTDMLLDTNRTGTFSPGAFAQNIVGSGASILLTPAVVPLPATFTLLATSMGLWFLAFFRRRCD